MINKCICYKKKDDIYHHGVKGQKWGVITKQNRVRVVKRRFKAYSRMTPKEKDKFLDNIHKLNSSKKDLYDNQMEVNYHRRMKKKIEKGKVEIDSITKKTS